MVYLWCLIRFDRGLLLLESRFRYQLEADVELFCGLLLELFFLVVDMSLDLAVVHANLGAIFASVAARWRLNAVTYGVARVAKSGHHEALPCGRKAPNLLLCCCASVVAGRSGQINANMTAIMPFQWRLRYCYQSYTTNLPIGSRCFGWVIGRILKATGHAVAAIDLNEDLLQGCKKCAASKPVLVMHRA